MPAVKRSGQNVAFDTLAGTQDVLEIEVEKAATQTLVPGVVTSESEALVLANREASGPDGASLGWVVELEL